MFKFLASAHPCAIVLMGLSLGLGLSNAARANIEFENPSIEEVPDQSALQSLGQLQSLKNLSKQHDYQAPFVQELKSHSAVRTLLVSTPALPIVDIQLTFNAGSARDDQIGEGLYGLSNMAARLMTEGTDQFTAKQLASQFESLGARFSVNAYRDMFVVRLRVLSNPEKLDAAINLMLHVVNRASFNQSGLNLILNNTRVGQRQVQENPNRLMNIRFYRAVYGQHPYAEPIVGTQGSIKKIGTEQLVKFRNQFLVAQNMGIAITGDLNAESASKIASRISLTVTQGHKAPPLVSPTDQNDFNIHFIPYNSTQAHVMIGHLAISRNDPDRVALEVANQLFGGSGFNSILMKELRVKRGYTYGAYSSLASTQAQGLFTLSYSTQQDQLLDSIQVVHQALNNFIHQPIAAKTLEETKEGMLRSFPMTFSSNDSINAQVAAIGFYDLPTNYLSDYQKQLSKLSVKQVQLAIKKHLRADRLTMVVVANQLDPAQLKLQLESQLHPTSDTTKKRSSQHMQPKT
ncbi:zinc protease [Acinetobacter calcoaceticus]|uniref:Zinc protease n=1 Tax=Acinetobacter calcoaceticus TaxID=471 RepID=A0A4R1XKG9_ACICA|nr:zinc protease [Acinetobacter calcoaceticus]